jgi:ammonium transporter Rh
MSNSLDTVNVAIEDPLPHPSTPQPSAPPDVAQEWKKPTSASQQGQQGQSPSHRNQQGQQSQQVPPPVLSTIPSQNKTRTFESLIDQLPFMRNPFSTYVVLLELFMIIIYGTCVQYGKPAAVSTVASTDHEMNIAYAMYQDVHVMIFIGFGFLYTLLRKYAWSGVSYNFLIAVAVVQFSILTDGFWRNVAIVQPGVQWPKISLDLLALINADFVAGTVLISFGAVIGRVSATQMLIMAILESIFATANVGIAIKLGISDPGGSMLIHVFGAAFGLALAAVVGDKALTTKDGESKLGTTRVQGTFAMIGTLFLFVFWPSFNAATLIGSAQERAVINTTLAICASALTSFALSRSIHKGLHFDMEHVQNATLAGGVAMGAACNMISNPAGALITGCVAGFVSTFGFSFFTPWLKSAGLTKKLPFGITDTCGILNLHFLPGVIGALASSIAAGGITTPPWTDSSILSEFPLRGTKTAVEAGGYQMAFLLITLLLSISSGIFTGYVIKLPFAEPMVSDFYEDASSWNVPFDDEEQPETDKDIVEVLNIRERRILDETMYYVFTKLQKEGFNVGTVPPLPTQRQTTQAQSSPMDASSTTHSRSANDRWTDGSVKAGTAAMKDPSVHNGKNRFQ